MVAYLFPPLGGGGVQRTVKFATYLPNHGWLPVVLTARGAGYEIRDPGLLSAVPPRLEVMRATTHEPWWPAYRGLQRLAARLGSRRGAITRPATASTTGDATEQPSGRVRRLAALVLFPDEHVPWVPAAVIAGWRAHRRQAFDAIYSTHGPISNHLVAALLKRRTGLPWIADFRDPWVGNAWATRLPRLHRKIQLRLERWIVKQADGIVTATPGLTEMFRRRYPEHAERITTITNGYDPADLADLHAIERADGRFRIVYTGALYGDSELDDFLRGLALLLDRRPAVASRLRVEFVGYRDAHNQAIAARWSRRLEGCVEYIDYRPRSEALALAASADACLYLVGNDPRKALAIGGKLFEYIALNVPILAVAPPGDARMVLEQLGWGHVCDPRSEAIADALEDVLDAPRPTGIADPDGHYDRRRLTGDLAALLDEIVGRSR